MIIPLYNKERWVKHALDSVLEQTYENLEILVVNDGSTDRSVEAVQGIKDERIRLIEKPNGGVSSARNRGIEEAKGEYIAFLDADDVWYPQHIEVLTEGFVRYPEAAILANRLVYRFEDAEKEAGEHAHTSVNYDALDFITALGRGEFPIHIGSTLFRTSLLHEKHLRFNENMRLAEDVNFTLRAGRYGKVILSDYTGMVYYQDDAQSAMKQKAKTAILVPLFFEGMEKELWLENEKKQIEKFLFREYLKKAYQNRGLPFKKDELSMELGGSSIEIGKWSVIPYLILRYTPEFLFRLYRDIKQQNKSLN